MTYIYDEDMKLFSPEMIEEIQNQNPFVRISEAVYSILEDAILTSKLRPGSKLKINKIADELNVSGTPVREAVERLTARGLVLESMINGGKYKNYYVFDLSEDDIENLFEARKAIVKDLVKSRLIRGSSGKGGGYELLKKPEEYTVGEILEATEGPLNVVACLAGDAGKCPRAGSCKTLPLWAEYDKMSHDYFFSKKLSDLM